MKARIILWDEVSTTPARAMDAANACLQDLCGSELPFGGKIVVFGGDTRQTLPVVEGGSRADIVASAVTSSLVWTRCSLIPISLDFNLRAATDPEFRAFLLRVGNGRQPFQLEYGPAAIFLPADIAAPHEWSLQDLLEFVYGDVVALSQRLVRDPTDANLDFFGKRALLAPKNEDVSKLNALLLQCFPPEQVQSFPSTTYISGGSPDDYAAYPVEFLNSLELSGLPPAILKLCPGAIVILLRNLAYEQGLCNGTRCIVLRATPRILDVMVLTGYSRGKRAWIPRIPLSPTETVLPVRIVRRQFPVRLAWAMTINKAQGQSLLRHLAFPWDMLLLSRKCWSFAFNINIPSFVETFRIAFFRSIAPHNCNQLAARCSTFGFRLWLIPTTTRIRTWTVVRCAFSRWRSHTHSCPCWPGPFPGARRRRPCRCKPLYTEYRLPWSLAKLKQKSSICVQQRYAIFHPSVLQLHCIKFTCPDILQPPAKAASPPSIVSWSQWPLWSRCYDNLYLHVTSIRFEFGKAKPPAQAAALFFSAIPPALASETFVHQCPNLAQTTRSHNSPQELYDNFYLHVTSISLRSRR